MFIPSVPGSIHLDTGVKEYKNMAEATDENSVYFEEDWDVDDDIDFEAIRIFDDTETRSTEIVIHHDLAD